MAGVISPEMILDQLRCSGLMEAVRVSRAGFPVRILHNDFISRYALLTVRLSSQAGMRDVC
jgi:myosin heavy subunit